MDVAQNTDFKHSRNISKNKTLNNKKITFLLTFNVKMRKVNVPRIISRLFLVKKNKKTLFLKIKQFTTVTHLYIYTS